MIPFSDYFLIAGAGLILIASLGILRMPDLYLRMHASAKAGTLGAGLVLGGAVLFFADWLVAIELLMAIFFLILTAPVAFHLLGRAGYRQKLELHEKTKILKD
ncbi:monovalent cation/H(+) antiporter subunit G [Legionella londiniensis]|uniref:Na(+)/H(+) antiporter subunit G n=1 Tax=Legionella londiniensis TaxID=45068 RepID=A0A0W0VTM2_9GAMM|nr:monovalent cation/H(+) antiporter subunit G [Legionella londiniensis]KTD23209.1 Na(+)/H(+) antiporter subunit G [Legionella londiniensis]STX93780.1 Multiple resistance and pH homeostasis protein G [Legionella londiniensis]